MRLVFLVVCLLLSAISYSQESAGLIFGKQNGLLVGQINPSYILRSENKWDLQLVGAHAFFQTNYAFIDNSSLISVLRNTGTIEIPENDTPISQYERPLIFRNGENAYYLDASGEVFAPGFLYRITEGIAAGFSVRGRSMMSGHDFPAIFDQANMENFPLDSTFQLTPFSANAAAWTEYSFHGAMDLSNGYQIGVTAKYLKNKFSAFVDNNIETDISRATTNIFNSSLSSLVEFGSSTNTSWGNNQGSGFALDLGFKTTQLFPFEAEVGVSLLDIGYLKNSSTQYRVLGLDGQNLDINQYQNIESIDQLVNTIDNDVFQIDSTAGFTTYLPTALSIQIIRPINDKISIEGSLTQRIVLSDRQLQRPNSINASFVYETRSFSAFVPITIYDYKHIRIGTAVRLWYFTIGTDYLTSVISNQQDFDGTDIYVNLKVYPFNKRNSSADGITCPF